MSIMTQGFLPFNFGIRANADGTCSTPSPDMQEIKPFFPNIKGRRIWNKKHPEIANYPEAIAFCVNIYCEEYAVPMTWGILEKVLKAEGFPKMNKGNITNAINMGLITRVGIKDFQKSKRGEQLLASNVLGDNINALAWNFTNWFEDIHDGTETPFRWNEHREVFMNNLLKSIKQRGFFETKVQCDPIDVHLPF